MKSLGNLTKTNNGDLTFKSSLNSVADLIFKGPSFRPFEKYEVDNEFLNLFNEAYKEDPKLAYAALALLRDPRQGLGERGLMQMILRTAPASQIEKLDISLIPKFGRWDDVLHLLKNENLSEDFKIHKVCKLIIEALMDGDNLCAKWMPRKGPEAKAIFKRLNKLSRSLEFNEHRWRILVVSLTDVVETKMCNNQWSEINYSHVPSQANKKYSKTFLKHDQERRREFLISILKGINKINASVLYPNQVVRSVDSSLLHMNEDDRLSVESMWKSLPDYLEDSQNIKLLPMIDTSYSMYSGSTKIKPITTSVTLGVYIAERNKGALKDIYMTFDTTPTINVLKGENIIDKLVNVYESSWGGSTNIVAAFNLLLDLAKRNNISQEEMPTHIIIFSDMQFDSAIHKDDINSLDGVERSYKESGYSLPNIIFWNINNNNTIPITTNDKGVALLSGDNPAVISSVLKGEIDILSVVNKLLTKNPDYLNFYN